MIGIISCLGIAVPSRDIKDCHKLGKASPNNIVVRFANRKFCYQALVEKLELHKLGSDKLVFNPVKKLYFSKNLTLFIQSLACKCRKLKRVSLIHSTSSARDVIKIRNVANERALPVKDENELGSLYLDFVFMDRQFNTSILEIFPFLSLGNLLRFRCIVSLKR